jgi:hypothetical protein
MYDVVGVEEYVSCHSVVDCRFGSPRLVGEGSMSPKKFPYIEFIW